MAQPLATSVLQAESGAGLSSTRGASAPVFRSTVRRDGPVDFIPPTLHGPGVTRIVAQQAQVVGQSVARQPAAHSLQPGERHAANAGANGTELIPSAR